MRIVLLGAPGAGKGTQAQLLHKRLSIPHLATGDMFRAAIKDKTEVGQLAEKYVSAGDLVPDNVTIEIIRQRIAKEDCSNGFILDGFPRTISQAEGLEKMLQENNISLNCVFSIEVDEEEIIRRRAGRLVAPTSGRVYHSEFNPPKVAGKCDESGEELVQREDDSEEIIRHRLTVYKEQTAPVKAFYQDKGLVQEINGMQPVETVLEALLTTVHAQAA